MARRNIETAFEVDGAELASEQIDSVTEALKRLRKELHEVSEAMEKLGSLFPDKPSKSGGQTSDSFAPQ